MQTYLGKIRVTNYGIGPNGIMHVNSAAVREWAQQSNIVLPLPGNSKSYPLPDGLVRLSVSMKDHGVGMKAQLLPNLTASNTNNLTPNEFYSYSVGLASDGKTWTFVNFQKADSDKSATLTPKPIAIPTFGTTFTPSWEGLASWTRGQKRPGPRYERVMVTNPAERCSERQIKVRGIIECNWPSDQFAIQDVTIGVQKGCDFCVYSKTGNLIAKIDAKSSNTMSAAQVRTALECEQAGIEYWIVSETRRMLITSQCQFEPTQYRVHEGENNGSTKD